MIQIPLFPLVSLFCFVAFGTAWRIHEDCEGPQREFVEKGLQNAFMLNNLAMAAFGSPSAAQTQVIEWLFGPPENTGTRERLGAKLNFISAVNRPNQAAGDVGVDDFVVHCTEDRIEKRPREERDGENDTRFFDNELGQNIHTSQKLFDCSLNVAYVNYPKPNNEGGYVRERYNVLQICPNFLTYAMGRDPAFQNALDVSTGTKLMEKIASAFVHVKYTSVDFVTLFDKVLLHEISHTSGAGNTDDVGGTKGYGWKNCRKLSTVVSEWEQEDYQWDDIPTVQGPEQNADTIALFGSAMRMIRDGAIINIDGNFVQRGASRIKRAMSEFRALALPAWD
ncbi:hypothetical protein EJ04DRAFT_564839 [Polyplosphaeria fusca]|uniref:Lysine-specific metallo-endopeptidase domain-containing protein n=1 Tax=Polyplosphaeria fusca TaxID=682080 RepID=A0A9P4V0P5_9PLEO|nr:hypothetical protein EJ04DRAFT_564839 [Polyplosphaeria fusca]